MKNPIFKVKGKFQGVPWPEAVRGFCKEDFDIVEYSDIPEPYCKPDSTNARNSISCRYVLKIKQEVLEHLAKCLGTETFSREGDQEGAPPCLEKIDSLHPVCDSRRLLPTPLYVEVITPMTYRGIARTDEARQEKYTKEAMLLKKHWEEQKEYLLSKKLAQLSLDFSTAQEVAEKKFKEAVVKCVRDLSIRESWLEDEGGDWRDAEKVRIQGISDKIAELKKDRDKAELELADFDRGTLINYFLLPSTKLTQAVKDELVKVAAESAGKVPSTRKRGMFA